MGELASKLGIEWGGSDVLPCSECQASDQTALLTQWLLQHPSRCHPAVMLKAKPCVLGSTTGTCFRGMAPNVLLLFSWDSSEAFSQEQVNLWVIHMRLDRAWTGYLVHLLFLGREKIFCPCSVQHQLFELLIGIWGRSVRFLYVYGYMWGRGREMVCVWERSESSRVEPGVWNGRTISSLNFLDLGNFFLFSFQKWLRHKIPHMV